jgi:hypothetical protein
MKSIAQRAGYVFLCAVPFLNFAVVGARALRVSELYQIAGVAYCAAMVIAAWNLCARAVLGGTEREHRLALAGGFFILPTAVVALLWVGLGPPWYATPVENRMRYLVLVLASIAVTAGFLLLEEAVREAGERFLSKLAAAFAILAGAAYLIWNSHYLGVFVIKVRTGQFPAGLDVTTEILDSLLFAACVLTYLATLVFAVSMSRVSLLGRRGKLGYMIASLILLALLLARGLSYPDPKARSTPVVP